MKMDDRSLISLATGSSLIEVVFVMDYLQFNFEDWRVNLYSPPVVIKGRRRYVFPEQGSRRELIGLVGSVLLTLDIDPKEEVIFAFSNGSYVSVRLDNGHRLPRSESVTFMSADHQCWDY